MESKIKEFIDYLFYIGIASTETFPNLVQILTSKTSEYSENPTSKKQKIDHKFYKSLITDYLLNLTKSQIEEIASNIYSKYESNKYNTTLKFLRKIIKIRYKQEIQILQNSFNIWKEPDIFLNFTSKKDSKYNTNNNDLNIINSNNNNNNTNNQTININFNTMDPSISLNLTNNLSNTKIKHKNKQNNAFKNLKKTSYQTLNSNKNKSNPSFRSVSVDSRKFFERMNKFMQKKEEDKRRLENFQEEQTILNCTFNPNLSLTMKKNKASKSKIKNTNMESISIKKNNDLNLQGKLDVLDINFYEKPKRKVNHDAIIRLYKDYEKKKEMKEELSKKFKKADGITFSPNVNINDKYIKNIKDDFLTRNQKMLEEKKDFIENFIYLRNLEMKGKSLNDIANLIKSKE